MARTAVEVIDQAYREQPYLNLATTLQGDVIGAWSDDAKRFVVVACLALTGEWVAMPYEILINGERPVREWIAVPKLVRPEALYFA